jgi:hypothetical protein
LRRLCLLGAAMKHVREKVFGEILEVLGVLLISVLRYVRNSAPVEMQKRKATVTSPFEWYPMPILVTAKCQRRFFHAHCSQAVWKRKKNTSLALAEANPNGHHVVMSFSTICIHLDMRDYHHSLQACN